MTTDAETARAFVWRNITKPALIRDALLGAVVVAVLIFGVKTCWNGKKDSADNAQSAVLIAKLRDDSLVSRSKDSALAVTNAQLTAALAHGTQIVDRWQTVKVPVYLPPTSTPHDTIASVAKRLSACYVTGDSLVASVVAIKSKCEAYRDTATATIAANKTAYSHLDSLYQITRKGKRLQSYADILYEPLKQRPIAGLGFTSRLFWKIDGKAEVQYAVPRSKPDSTDGFRLLVGAHLRF